MRCPPPPQVFEVLAQVPWLNDDDLAQKELKGIAMVREGAYGMLMQIHQGSASSVAEAGPHITSMHAAAVVRPCGVVRCACLQVGLLGTLEEVGFDIRHQVERVWAGGGG